MSSTHFRTQVTPVHPKLPSWSYTMLAKTNMLLSEQMQRPDEGLANAIRNENHIYKTHPDKRPPFQSYLPPGKPVVATIHHVRIVPTLSLTTKQSLSDSGIALLLVLHSRLQDTRVRKID